MTPATVSERSVTNTVATPHASRPRHVSPPPPDGPGGGSGDRPAGVPLALAIVIVVALAVLLTYVGMITQVWANLSGAQLPGA